MIVVGLFFYVTVKFEPDYVTIGKPPPHPQFVDYSILVIFLVFIVVVIPIIMAIVTAIYSSLSKQNLKLIDYAKFILFNIVVLFALVITISSVQSLFFTFGVTLLPEEIINPDKMRSYLMGIGNEVDVERVRELEQISIEMSQSDYMYYQGARDDRNKWNIEPPFYVIQATMKGLKTNVKMNLNICTNEKDKFVEGMCYKYQHSKIWGNGCHISEYLTQIPCE